MGKKSPLVGTADGPALEATLSDGEIDRLVDDLAALHRSATLDFALKVGRMVVERIYGGDIAAWRERGPKDGSFRKLAAKVDKRRLPGLSATSLQRAVATVDVEDRVGVSGRPQLNAAHVRAVLGLPAAQQERLLGLAEAKDWAPPRLDKEAERVRRGLTGRMGRTPLPAFVKTVNRWGRELADADAFGDLERAKELTADDSAGLVKTLTAMKQRCEALLAALNR